MEAFGLGQFVQLSPVDGDHVIFAPVIPPPIITSRSTLYPASIVVKSGITSIGIDPLTQTLKEVDAEHPFASSTTTEYEPPVNPDTAAVLPTFGVHV